LNSKEAAMQKRKALAIALAAAGLAGAAAIPLADSGEVFVPELAVMDGALCTPPNASGFALVRLAQAAQDAAKKKTEISPAAPDVA
jgi:hypothetical protein